MLPSATISPVTSLQECAAWMFELPRQDTEPELTVERNLAMNP